MDPELRLAIIATPRSGNAWLRLLLTDLLELQALAVHDPSDCPWDSLPPRFLLAVHWHRTPQFQDLLARHRFRIVGIHRHPLDTLISILHVSLHDVQSHRWLGGEGGTEEGIVGAMPLSRAFREYAVGPRPRALFGVNLEWFDHPARYNVCFEDLVARPESTLAELLAWLGEALRCPMNDVIAGHSLSANREAHFGHGHFWKGQPGLWRSLLCRRQAELFARAHASSFTRFGYACDPNPDLTPAQADANWIGLVHDEDKRLTSEAFSSRVKLAQTCAEVQALQAEVARLTGEKQDLQAKLAGLTGEKQELVESLARYNRLGTLSMAFLRRLAALCGRDMWARHASRLLRF
jgi:hypothetical protein